MRARFVFVASLSCAACTTFNDITVPDASVDAGPLAPGYLALDDAARLCRWVLECPRLGASIAASIAVPLSAKSFSSCVAWAAGPVPPSHTGIDVQQALMTEIAGATSCDDALSRTFIEFLDAADPACSAPGSSCESPTTALNCSLKLRSRCDTPVFAPGTSCLESATDARCASDTCAPGPNPKTSCDETVWENCQFGLVTRIHCEAHSLACTQAYCQPSKGTENSCTGAGTTSCEGTLALACDGLVPSPFDCGELPGGTCAFSANQAHCTTVNAACSPFDADQSQCSGDAISVCLGGTRASVDCAALGLSCVAADAARTARCAAP